MEADDVCVFEYAADVLEVLEHMVDLHLVIIGCGFLQQYHPRLLHDGFE